jgi:hypothetical protein
VLSAISKSDAWTTKMLGMIAGGVDGGEIFAPDALERLYNDTGVPEDERLYEWA